MTSLCGEIRFKGKLVFGKELGMALDRHHHHHRLPIPSLGGWKETDMLFDTYTGTDLAT